MKASSKRLTTPLFTIFFKSVLIISLFFSTLLLFMMLALFFGAPLVPSKPEVARKMVELLKIKPGMTIYDLGSGDGRVLIELAKRNVFARGIEINPYAVAFSFVRCFIAGVRKQVQVRWGNYWWTNLAQANGVIVYGLPQIMPRLAQKFKAELRPKTRIVSNSFQIPGLHLLKEAQVGKTKIYLYQV